MVNRWIQLLLLMLVADTTVTAFSVALSNHHKLKSTTTRMAMSSFSENEESASSSSSDGTWKLVNDFPQFLNQCAIQSFCFTLRNLRDPMTVRWIDNFTNPVFEERKSTDKRLTGTTKDTMEITSNPSVSNPDGRMFSKLHIYHGLAIMNTTKFPTWESYFSSLLEMPLEGYIVESSRPHVADYELEINPASLCSRIISVRDQIANELENDLGVLADYLGHHTMDAYWHYLDYGEGADESNEDGISQNALRSEINYGEVTMSSGDSSQRKLAPPNLVFLEYKLDEPEGVLPSALRKGNFDLVTLLATQEAIHRLLNNKESKVKYLRDFYTNRIFTHFTGIQRYGRADDFLEELLFSSGRCYTSDGESIMADPVQLTEMILKERSKVALEWQAMCREIPTVHMAIKRLQLNRLMQSYNTNADTASSTEEGQSGETSFL